MELSLVNPAGQLLCFVRDEVVEADANARNRRAVEIDHRKIEVMHNGLRRSPLKPKVLWWSGRGDPIDQTLYCHHLDGRLVGLPISHELKKNAQKYIVEMSSDPIQFKRVNSSGRLVEIALVHNNTPIEGEDLVPGWFAITSGIGLEVRIEDPSVR